MENGSNVTPVQTTGVSLQILEFLVEAQEARLDEIADALGISESTTHRHLQTLETHGYVASRSGRYEIGLEFLNVAGHIRTRDPGYSLAKDAVLDLVDSTDRRCMFAAEHLGQSIRMFMRTGNSTVQSDTRIGKRMPMHASASGKAILAEYPDAQVRRIIADTGLPKITDNTITDEERLMEEVTEIRERGIAFNREESIPNLRSLSTAINNPDGTVLGALVIAGSTHNLDDETFFDEYPDLLEGKAQQLELDLKLSG